MRRAKEDLDKARPFFDTLADEIGSIFRHAGEIDSPYLCADGESDDARWPLTARTAGGRLVHCTGDRADLGEYRDVKITDSNTWALFGAIE